MLEFKRINEQWTGEGLPLGDLPAGRGGVEANTANDCPRAGTLQRLEHWVGDVRKRYADRGKTEIFDALKEYLGYDPGGVPYVELSRRLGQSEAALRTALSRLRARWRSRLRELVAETVQEGHMVDDELNGLIRALAPPP